MNRIIPPCFIVDATLGRLGKWLRLLGFDTIYDACRPDVQRLLSKRTGSKRIILTRSRLVFRRLPQDGSIFIRSDHAQDQMRQLVCNLGLTIDLVMPLSRCATCNTPIHSIDKAKAAGKVPDYIFQSHNSFKICESCSRLYWPGTHARRWLAMTQQWFT